MSVATLPVRNASQLEFDVGSQTKSNGALPDSRPASNQSLVLEHLDSVRSILNRVMAELPSHVDTENLQSAGTLGLVQAARKYDPTRGVAFRSYAHRRIRGAMIDELRRNCPLPQRVLENLSTVRAQAKENFRPACIHLLAEQTGLTIADIKECLEAARLTSPSEFDEAGQSDPGTCETARPELAIEAREVRDQLGTALKQLPTRERLTITLYYLEGLRLREIGQVLGVSESRTSRLLEQARSSLRAIMRAMGVSELSDLPAAPLGIRG